jgi:hypothetical protein
MDEQLPILLIIRLLVVFHWHNQETITFDSTEDIARQKIVDGILGYWLR